MPYTVVRVGTQRIQELFEEEGFRDPELFERFGIVVVELPGQPPGPNAPDNLPIGTLSLELSYREANEDGEELARAHVFKKPDGSYGASGIPDPKVILVKETNTLYLLDKTLDAEYRTR
ncbi:MAG: hypothetical protein M3R70_07900 [Actinomycetota bacterium]|nr:hypothetical protein [Actinomycetota bacterium]